MMAAFACISRFVLCILFIYFIDSNEAKRSKPQNHHKCTREFLWEALTAAGKGNDSSTNFLATELNTLGFTKDGIRSKSIASNWQSKLHKIPGESIFSNLQKLGMLDLTVTQQCEHCDQTDKVEIVTLAGLRKAEKSSYHINMKHLVREINKLYADPLKIRNKRLRKVLKKFLSDDMLCADQKTARRPPEKKNKDRNGGLDSAKICLRMIQELLDWGLCEDVNESFHWTYSQVSENYRTKISFSAPAAVTAQVP